MTHEAVHDHTGQMTRTVKVNAMVLQAIAGRDGIDDRQYAAPLPSCIPDYTANLDVGVRGLRIGILKEAFEFDGIMDPRVRTKVLQAAQAFSDLGAEVREVSVPLHTIAGHIVECALRPAAAQQAYLGRACGRHGLYLTRLAEKMAPLDQDKFEKARTPQHNQIANANNGQMATPSKFQLLAGLHCWNQVPSIFGKAMNLYRRLRDEYDAALQTVDVLTTPTTPYVAKRHPPSNCGPAEAMNVAQGVAINTVCFNASGHPAMSLPVGKLSPEDDLSSGLKLPVGMQIVGRHFEEALIYQVGAGWEGDWKTF
jgi:amidase